MEEEGILATRPVELEYENPKTEDGADVKCVGGTSTPGIVSFENASMIV